jgi:hypothetical protein
MELTPERRRRVARTVARLREDLAVFHAERVVDAEAERIAAAEFGLRMRGTIDLRPDEGR